MSDLISEKMLSVKQASKELDKAEITIRQWISGNKIKSVKVMGSRRIPQSEIDRIKKGE